MEWPGDFPQDHAFVELLVPGVSSEMDYQQLLQDTEEKLNLNACSIEQSLKELQAKMGDGWTGDRPASPTEILQWLSLQNTTGTRPVTTGHQQIMDFLKALQQYVGSDEEGREEAALQLLVNLSSQCGVSFSCTPSSSSCCPPTTQQAASPFPVVNTVRDNCSLEVQAVWDDVRLQLRRHLVGRLSSCCPDRRGPERLFALSIAERVHCLQRLCFLYPESEVLSHYQVVRSQWVLSVLRAGLSSCPVGETGFDRVSSAFRSARPALIQAVREELHMLGRIVETHRAIVGFLDEAYLAPLARELTSMMERESETALKDNTTLSGRIRRYSAKSRATVAPMELPKNVRSFSLTSHQLASITQLACTLLWLESSVEELAVNMAFINSSKDTPCVKGILKKTREETREETCATAADGTKVPGEHLLHSPEALLVDFDWRSAFRGLVPQMAHCVKVVLEDVCIKSLQQEEASFTSGQTLIELCKCAGHTPVTVGDQLVGDDSSHTWPEMDTPRMIAKFCAAVVAELEALLPLAVACRDGPLVEVRSSFVEACARVTSAALSRVEERARQVPSSAPLKNLPTLLASCACISQRLAHYHAKLCDTTATTAATRVPLTLLPIQRYKDMAEALRDQLTSYSVQVCSTSILHDAESHFWMDPKPFYEGERCSFSLQMWFYFLCGLRNDLWAVLPASWARGVLAQVLGETLQLLVQRYSRARPSYKRHPQIRCDITAVLLYVEQLMCSVSESPEALVRPLTSPAAATDLQKVDWSARIHHLCDQLLTVMVIGTAPLPMLYGNFMSESVKEDSEATNPHGFIGVHWLHALHPDLYPEQSLRDGPVGPAACLCQLRLLTSDPGYSPRLLLRTLLHGDCHLPRTLLEHSHLCGESGSEVSPEDSEAGSDFVAALFNLLSVLSSVPQALTQALEPYLDRGHVWEHLYSLPDTTRSVPPLVSCVRAVISKPAHCLLAHLVPMVMAWQGAEEPSRVLFSQAAPQSVLARVPREWNYNPQEARGKEPAAKGVLPLAVQALSMVFTNLPMAVASLPLPVRFLFHAAEKRLSQHARQLRSTGLLLRALLGCLVQCLEDPDTAEQVSVALNRGAKDCLALLAECLQATMGIQQKGVPKPAVHKVLQALEENRPKWTALMLQKARKLCSDSAFERRRWESAGAQERGGGGEVAAVAAVAAAELTEQKIGLMLLESCQGAGGSPYLRQIHHIIRGNEELLMSTLAGNTDAPPHATHRANFDPGPESDVAPSRFNPLVQFDHVGRERLEQSAVADWTWDWPKLLPAYQAMSRVTFTTLLANRWEMQDDAALEDEEGVLVEKIKAVFFPCDRSPRVDGDDDDDVAGACQTQTESPPEDAQPPGESVPR